MCSDLPASERAVAESADRTAVLELRHITKRFPGVLANDDVSVSVSRGEVLALLGENGAGKSTLMNVAFGLLEPDSGEILVGGAPAHIRGPRDAIDLGIGMVHQHFMLVEPFTVTENIVLGAEPVGPGGVIMGDAARNRALEISEKYGLKIEPDTRIADLSVGMQQRVEILKALYREVSILILDEPTAVLTPQEVDELFDIVRQLVDGGLSVVIITHKLDEVMEFADRIIVMRSGRVVGETKPAECSEADLARMMVGRDVVLKVEKGASTPREVALEVNGLEVVDDRKLQAVKGVSLSVRFGEIVGIAGVDGNGQRELVEAIVGLRKPSVGRITLKGEDITRSTAAQRIARGIAHVPEDRHRRGLVLEFDLVENIALGGQRSEPLARHGLLSRRAMSAVAAKRIADYDVRTPNLNVAAGNLSGGNQQKLVLARELGRDPDVLIAAQPTRGLDVGAIEFVHRRLIAERDSGKAVLLVSMELEEVMSLSDRILVMFEGKIVGEFEAGTASDVELGFLMTGGGSGAEGDEGRGGDERPEASGA